MLAVSTSQPTLFEYPHEYPISLYSFKLPGLGVSGPLCGHKRLTHFSDTGAAARFGSVWCGRIECPTCWPFWARLTVFHLALRVEAYARAHGKRPYSAVLSVPPSKVEDKWSWERVSSGLFRRGYRRIRELAGMAGGVCVFHPYRIKPRCKSNFRASGEHRDTGMWKLIRERVQNGENLYNFVELGPHLHSITFGAPRAHSCKDYVIKFNDNGEGEAVPMEEVKDTVAYLRYLISHTGILTHLTAYKSHSTKPGAPLVVRHQLVHTVRSFGALFRINPKSLLGEAAYHELAEELAECLGMIWDREGESLRYPASCKELGTGDEGITWVPLWKLGSYLSRECWFNSLTLGQSRFWSKVWQFTRDTGPPLLENLECLNLAGPLLTVGIMKVERGVQFYNEKEPDEEVGDNG